MLFEHNNIAKDFSKECHNMDSFALILVIIGALNWGSVGIFGVDLVGTIFGGQGEVISRILYTLVGLAGLWAITLLFRETDRAQLRDYNRD